MGEERGRGNEVGGLRERNGEVGGGGGGEAGAERGCEGGGARGVITLHPLDDTARCRHHPHCQVSLSHHYNPPSTSAILARSSDVS